MCRQYHTYRTMCELSMGCDGDEIIKGEREREVRLGMRACEKTEEITLNVKHVINKLL